MIRSDASSLLKINTAKKWSRLEEEPSVIENSGGFEWRDLCIYELSTTPQLPRETAAPLLGSPRTSLFPRTSL